jgi:hypothetical protein
MSDTIVDSLIINSLHSTSTQQITSQRCQRVVNNLHTSQQAVTCESLGCCLRRMALPYRSRPCISCTTWRPRLRLALHQLRPTASSYTQHPLDPQVHASHASYTLFGATDFGSKMQAIRGLASSLRAPFVSQRRPRQCALPSAAPRRAQRARASIATSSTTNCAVPELCMRPPEPLASMQELIQRIMDEKEPRRYEWCVG